jgi:glycosyltransferase involved in cell wall biosynthesis
MAENILNLARKRFVIYVPNAELTRFHERSPWLMFPRSFQELGYESTLICAKFSGKKPAGFRIIESSLVVTNPRMGGRMRSILEPLLVFGEIVNQRPDTVMISPLRSSLFTLLPLVFIYRRVYSRGKRDHTRFILKSDTGLDYFGLSPLAAYLSGVLLVLSTLLLDLVSLETSCGVERARRLSGIQSRKLIRVPLGFPQGRIDRTTYQGSSRDPVILCVARIARMKGQDVLLRAFSLLAAQFPAWSIRLIGPTEDPQYKDELNNFASRQGLTERISFLGFVEEAEMDREYSHASVFCLPSVHSENAGNVKYEATACGLPVVTTDVPCAQDATEMGWIVARAGDSADLALKLERLMRDENERLRVSKMAQLKQCSYLDLVKIYLSATGVESIGA